MNINTIVQGHVLEVLKSVPSESIDMVITSPPYWGLRNYKTNPQIWDGRSECEHEWESIIRKGMTGGTKSPKVQIKGQQNYSIVKNSIQGFCTKCGAWLGELGAEPTFQLYIQHLVEIFDEVKRTLKSSGSCWVNLGDSYNTSSAGNKTWSNGVGTNKFYQEIQIHQKENKQFGNIKKKSLVGIPDRFKIVMIDGGWICRNEIIWHKPNQMPTSAKDRFTVDFEKFYWFTKEQRYYFKQQFEPYTKPMNRWGGEKLIADNKSYWSEGTGHGDYRERNMRPNPNGKNKRTVWSINTSPLKDAHFATFPEKLIEIPIIACCPEGGVILDVFMGAGTTGLVAKKNNRNYIGIELNSEYIKIAEKRIKNG